ncbi:MAG: GNAT family N-acetyltransferase [Anaerocolumna sp.]
MEHSNAIIQEIEDYCMSKPGAYETRPFGKYPICYRVMGKIFAQFNPETSFFRLTLKSEPDVADFYRHVYKNIVVRGYHCPPIQQPHWNTINLDAFTDMDMLYQMIDEAYIAVLGKFSMKSKTQLVTLQELTFKDTDGEDPDFVTLCNRLDCTLDELVGEQYQRTQYDTFNTREHIKDVIVVYQDGCPIACGAFKMFDEDHAELKRIYIEPSIRKMGLGTELVRRLEAKAKIKGFKWCILETGKPLEVAQRLYKKAGYKIIPNYGQYFDMPNSICMERKI